MSCNHASDTCNHTSDTCNHADETTGVYTDITDGKVNEINNCNNHETEHNGVICETEIEQTNTHDITGVTHDTIDNTGVGNNNERAAEDNDISIESEEHDNDNHVTIDELSIIEQMNTAQINTDQETGDDAKDGVWHIIGNHGYNDRPRCMRIANMPSHKMVNNQLRLRWQNLTPM